MNVQKTPDDDHVECTSKVTAPTTTNVTAKITYLGEAFNEQFSILVLGYGTDPKNLTTILKKVYGSRHPPPIVRTSHTELWVRLVCNFKYTPYCDFEIQLVASSLSGKVFVNVRHGSQIRPKVSEASPTNRPRPKVTITKPKL